MMIQIADCNTTAGTVKNVNISKTRPTTAARSKTKRAEPARTAERTITQKQGKIMANKICDETLTFTSK